MLLLDKVSMQILDNTCHDPVGIQILDKLISEPILLLIMTGFFWYVEMRKKIIQSFYFHSYYEWHVKVYYNLALQKIMVASTTVPVMYAT